MQLKTQKWIRIELSYLKRKWISRKKKKKKCEKHFSLVVLRTTFFYVPWSSWAWPVMAVQNFLSIFWLKILYHPTLALFYYPVRQTRIFLFLLLSSICPAYIKLSRQSLRSTTSCILLLLVTLSFLFVLSFIHSNSWRTLLAFNMTREC